MKERRLIARAETPERATRDRGSDDREPMLRSGPRPQKSRWKASIQRNFGVRVGDASHVGIREQRLLLVEDEVRLRGMPRRAASRGSRTTSARPKLGVSPEEVVADPPLERLGHARQRRRWLDERRDIEGPRARTVVPGGGRRLERGRPLPPHRRAAPPAARRVALFRSRGLLAHDPSSVMIGGWASVVVGDDPVVAPEVRAAVDVPALASDEVRGVAREVDDELGDPPALPRRFIGVFLRLISMSSGGYRSVPDVRMIPGAIALTWMLCCAHSIAERLRHVLDAARAAPVWTMPGKPRDVRDDVHDAPALLRNEMLLRHGLRHEERAVQVVAHHRLPSARRRSPRWWGTGRRRCSRRIDAGPSFLADEGDERLDAGGLADIADPRRYFDIGPAELRLGLASFSAFRPQMATFAPSSPTARRRIRCRSRRQ